MGAIDQNGYRFEPEYSVVSQKGAIHVYQKGDFVKEIPFTFTGEQPHPDQIENLVNNFFEEVNKNESGY
ncbi:YbxH family protein [Fredinandcohnia quinoae]|uniref:YbxH family protein n=1 Tax=Fredinandcohnia quinoae TaxID=2918902 RepID=A0AAW5DY58_9BACI|nr:YbxH family protein [Fredinandcohnia sp. SECRCQ15]MCH1623975.1 YbxH family protein [Fredinandcohnia sp. SECRCQ15]